MSNASFKDYYQKKRTEQPASVEEHVTDVDNTVIEHVAPVIENDVVVEQKVNQSTFTALNEQIDAEFSKLRQEAEVTATLLKEQASQSKEMSESVTALTEAVRIITEEIKTANRERSKANRLLSEKITRLEEKLDENFDSINEINHALTQRRKVVKEVHRDRKGIITHIVESEMSEDDKDSEEQ